jgi:hypothetical protein
MGFCRMISVDDIHRHADTPRPIAASGNTPWKASAEAQLIAVYARWRREFPEAIAQTYVEALPWSPPLVESAADRRSSYKENTKELSADCGSRSGHRLASEPRIKKLAAKGNATGSRRC